MPTPGPNPRADLEAFWKHHYRYFLMVLMAIGATVDDAYDTVQDVIVDMLEKDTWSRLTRNPKAWVRKAVLHTYYDQQKRRRREREIERHCRRRLGATSMTARTSGRTGSGWRRCSARCRRPSATVFELVLAELDAREIADLLGKTPDTIRQNLAHARKRLRANLGEDYQIDPATCPAPVRGRRTLREHQRQHLPRPGRLSSRRRWARPSPTTSAWSRKRSEPRSPTTTSGPGSATRWTRQRPAGR